MASPVLTARAYKGVAARTGNASDVIEADRNLAAAKIQQYIERVVSTAPPLTADQRSRLASLLVGDAA